MRKNYFTKTLSAILVLMMVLSVMTFLPLTASAAEYDVSIATADDLLGLQAKIDALGNDVKEVRIQMTADIDMTGKAFTPINAVKSVTEGEGDAAVTTTYPKAVIFHGNGKSIKNLTIGSELVPYAGYAGLFETVGGGSSFESLFLDNVSIYGTLAAGALIGHPAAGDLTLNKVSVSGKVVSTEGRAGGLLGYQDEKPADEEYTWNISYCINEANVTGFLQSGGLIGRVYAQINMQVSYCLNKGAVTVTNTNGSYDDFCGGIIGNAANPGGKCATDIYFKNCVNTGTLSTSDINKNDGGVGGIMGDYRVTHQDPAGYVSTLVVENCFDYSERNVQNPNAASFNYAIAGYVANTEWKSRQFINCYGRAKGGATPYAGVNQGHATMLNTNCAVVTSGEATITMTTGKTSFEDMLNRLITAIVGYSEVEMPASGFTDGKTRDYTWYYKDNALVAKGTEAAPYEIATAEQWAGFSALSNGFHDKAAVGGQEKVDFTGKYFKLTGDIDLTGYQIDPIGGNNPAIVFDGNGKTISNLTQDGVGGLFSSLGRGSEVKNLSIKNMDIVTSGTAGFIAGLSHANVTFYNIKIDADSSIVTADNYAGALVGNLTDTAAEEGLYLKVDFCVNEGAITAAKAPGGMVGNASGSINFAFTCCVNKGTLTQTANVRVIMGGMIANTSRGELDTVNYFENCYNTGKFVSLATDADYVWIGAIVGDYRAASTNGSEVYFINCYDNGARDIADSNPDGNAAILGNADNGQIYKEFIACYGANPADTVTAYVGVSGQNGNAQFDGNSMVVFEGLEQQITNQWGIKSTMLAEMAAIDNAIATLTDIEKPICEHEYDNACDADCDLCGEERVPEDHVYDNDQDATCNVCGDERKVQEPTTEPNNQQPDNQQPGTENNNTTTEEKKGCGGSVNALYVVIALTAIVGFAFVAKKREEN